MNSNSQQHHRVKPNLIKQKNNTKAIKLKEFWQKKIFIIKKFALLNYNIQMDKQKKQ